MSQSDDDLLIRAGLLKPRSCAFCDKRFQPKRYSQVYCNEYCRRRGNALTRIVNKPVLTDRRCQWCGKRLESTNPKAKFCSNGCRLTFFKAKPCIYCGAVAEGRDHVIPKAFAQRVEDFANIPKRRQVVPCCTECNSTAGAKVFFTIKEKRHYIYEQYCKRYKKLLEAPKWTAEELNELGVTLRSHVVRDQALKDHIRRRIRKLGR